MSPRQRRAYDKIAAGAGPVADASTANILALITRLKQVCNWQSGMMRDYGGMAGMPGWMVTGMGIAGLIWLAVGIAVLVLIVVVVWLATRLRRDGVSGGRASTALDELDHRYARGEIDRDTYLQMRRDLVR